MFFGFSIFLYIGETSFRYISKKIEDPCYTGKKEFGKGEVTSFKIKGDRVCVDNFESNGSWSYEMKTLEGADAKSFKRINDDYFADKNYVYYIQFENNRFSSDLENFVYLKNDYAKDKINCYKRGKIIEMSECEKIENKKILDL